MLLASSLRRASDSSTPQRRWESSGIRLMTREMGSFWFMRKNSSALTRPHHTLLPVLLVAVVCLGGCGLGRTEQPLFKLLSPDETGVKFANTITTNDSINVQTDVYVY